MKKGIIIVIALIVLVGLITYAFAQENEKSDNEVKKEKIEKINSEITFIELGSVNCIPCKMMQPIMKEIEKLYPESVEVRFLDVWTEEGKSKGKEFNIRLIPTQVFLDENGEEFFRHEGFFSKDEIVELINKQLKTQ